MVWFYSHLLLVVTLIGRMESHFLNDCRQSFFVSLSQWTCCVIWIPISGSELLFRKAFNLLSFTGGSFGLTCLRSKSIFLKTLEYFHVLNITDDWLRIA